MPLTGTVTGSSRADLTKQATKEASTYYGTNCLEIVLSNEHTTDPMEHMVCELPKVEYRANYKANPQHAWDQQPLITNNATCTKCGEKW